MTKTIEIPRMWIFRYPCGCPYGAMVADQTFGGQYPDGAIIATPGHAWSEFYHGKKRSAASDKKAGRYVTPEDVFPPDDEWSQKTFRDGVCTVHEGHTA